MWRIYWFDLGGGVVPTSIFLTPHLTTMYDLSAINDFDKYDEPRLHMEKLLSAHLIEFDLSLRILCPLESAGIRTLGDLVKHSKKNLRKIRQVGELSIEILQNLLDRLGLSLQE